MRVNKLNWNIQKQFKRMFINVVCALAQRMVSKTPRLHGYYRMMLLKKLFVQNLT